MSSRHERVLARRSAKKNSALDSLEAAKRGSRRIDQFIADDEEDVYDEVTENEYIDIVTKRRQKGDFVVQDGALGYVDRGEEDWSDDASSKKKKKKTPTRPSGQSNTITQAFHKTRAHINKAASRSKPASSKKKVKSAPKRESDSYDFDSMLADLDENPDEQGHVASSSSSTMDIEGADNDASFEDDDFGALNMDQDEDPAAFNNDGDDLENNNAGQGRWKRSAELSLDEDEPISKKGA